jgi:hypothetical protein
MSSDSVNSSLPHKYQRDFNGHCWSTSLIRAKVRNDAETTPPSLSYPLCRYPIQPGVRNLIIYSSSRFAYDFCPTIDLEIDQIQAVNAAERKRGRLRSWFGGVFEATSQATFDI